MTNQTNTFRPYRRGDLKLLWKTLRAEDREELALVGLTTPALMEALVVPTSSSLLTWDSDAGPLAVLGAAPADDDPTFGYIWAIASTKAARRWRTAARHTEALLARLSQGYTTIGNLKPAGGTAQHIAWLRRLGFSFLKEEVRLGGGATSFHHFVRIVPQCPSLPKP